MARIDNSDFLSQGEVKASVQSTNPQHPDSHALPSLDHQSSIPSLLDVTFSGDIGSYGSMNIDDLLNNIWTEEEIETYEQTLLPNPEIAISAAAPMGAAIVPTAAAIAPTAAAIANINPQFPEGEIKISTVNDTAIQHSLQRQGSLTLPLPQSQNPMDEVWHEIQKLQQEQVHSGAANFQVVDSAQRQATDEEMNLEDFLIMLGVVRAHDRSPLLQQSCVSSQNNYNTAVGSGTPGCMVRPVIATGGGGNVPAYQPVPERSVKDAASAAVAITPRGYQQPEVRHGGKMRNNTGEGGFRQGSPASPVSSDRVRENQSDSVKNVDMDVSVAERSSGLAAKVVSRKQHRVIKNQESAARSRARRQAYVRDLEAQLQALKQENARLRQDMDMEEVMKSRRGKDGKKGLKRSRSSLY